MVNLTMFQGAIPQGVATGGNTLGHSIQAIFPAIILIIVVALLFLIMFIYTQFRYILIVYNCSAEGTTKLVEFGLARKVSNKDGQIKLQRLMRRKDFIPLPDEASITIIKGGRFICNFWKTIEGSYIPIESPNAVGKQLDSFNQVDRQVYVMEEKARIARAQTWKQMLLQIAPLMILAIVIICFFVFFDRVAKPIIEIQQNQAQYQIESTKMIKEVNTLIENKYRLLSGQEPVNEPTELSSSET